MSELPVTTIVALAAFAAGMIFGATAQRTNFCTMGAISDMVLMGDLRRFRAWMLAIAVATLVSQGMWQAKWIDLSKAIYLTPNLGWAGAILGGAMFGFGMTLAGGCGNKTLVRIGGGNLKSLVVFLVLGIFAYMTLRGLTGLARVELERVTNVNLAALSFGQAKLATQGMPEMLAAATGIGLAAARWLFVLLFSGGLAWFCFKDSEFRGSGRDVAAGLIIGLMVPVGWAVTGILGADEFEPTPIASFTFVAPIGESIQYLMSFTGSTINFGIAAVGGIIMGAFLASLATKSFHLEAFTGADDMIRHFVGAALMGTGGVLSMGCTIGQGLTGISTLAFGSLLAFLSIVGGGYVGMKYLEEGTLGGALKAALGRA